MQTNPALMPHNRQDYIVLPTYMRLALWATMPLNFLGAVIFLPSSEWVRNMAGLPKAGHPMYLYVIAAFIGIFGMAYGYCAAKNRASPEFLFVGAAGKIAFVAIVIAYFINGEIPLITTLLASADLALGALFLYYIATVASQKRQQV